VATLRSSSGDRLSNAKDILQISFAPQRQEKKGEALYLLNLSSIPAGRKIIALLRQKTRTSPHAARPALRSQVCIKKSPPHFCLLAQ